MVIKRIIFLFFIILLFSLKANHAQAASGCINRGTLFGTDIDFRRCGSWYPDYPYDCSISGVNNNKCCTNEQAAKEAGLNCEEFKVSLVKNNEACVSKNTLWDLGYCPNGYNFACSLPGGNQCCLNKEEAIKRRLACTDSGYLSGGEACVLPASTYTVFDRQNRFYVSGETFCKDSNVYKCNGSTITLDSNCPVDTLCVESTTIEGKVKADCLVKNNIGNTCGNPDGTDGSNKCCCTDINASIGGNFEQLDSNNIGTKITTTIQGLIGKLFSQEDLKAYKQINACMVGSKPNDANKICTGDCSCVYDTEANKNFNCNSYGAPGTAEYQKCVSSYKNSEMCNMYLTDKPEYSQCIDCFVGRNQYQGSSGYWSALGCIHFGSMSEFVQQNVFPMAISFAGFFALLCIIYSAFMMQTSQGNPEKIKSSQQNLTSCILGLMLIIFSVFILRLIGVSILKIPGLQ